MKTLTKIDPVTASKIATIMGIFWGLLVALVTVFLSPSYIDYMGRFYRIFSTVMPVSGNISLITLPLGYGATGLVIGYLAALLYNFVAKKFGGLKFDMK